MEARRVKGFEVSVFWKRLPWLHFTRHGSVFFCWNVYPTSGGAGVFVKSVGGIPKPPQKTVKKLCLGEKTRLGKHTPAAFFVGKFLIFAGKNWSFGEMGFTVVFVRFSDKVETSERWPLVDCIGKTLDKNKEWKPPVFVEERQSLIQK